MKRHRHDGIRALEDVSAALARISSPAARASSAPPRYLNAWMSSAQRAVVGAGAARQCESRRSRRRQRAQSGRRVEVGERFTAARTRGRREALDVAASTRRTRADERLRERRVRTRRRPAPAGREQNRDWSASAEPDRTAAGFVL